MSFSKNRKRSGKILAGVILSSSVVSAANQGSVSAVPQSKVINALNGLASNSTDISFKKTVGKPALSIIGIFVFIFFVGMIIYYNNRNVGNGINNTSKDNKEDNNTNMMWEGKLIITKNDGVQFMGKEKGLDNEDNNTKKEKEKIGNSKNDGVQFIKERCSSDSGDSSILDANEEILVNKFLESRENLFNFWKTHKVTFLDEGKVKVEGTEGDNENAEYSLEVFFEKFCAKYVSAFDGILESSVLYVDEDSEYEKFVDIDKNALSCIDDVFLKKAGFSFSSFVRCFFEKEYFLSYIFPFLYYDSKGPLSFVKIRSMFVCVESEGKNYSIEGIAARERKMSKVFKRFHDLYAQIAVDENMGYISVPEKEIEALSKQELSENFEGFLKDLCNKRKINFKNLENSRVNFKEERYGRKYDEVFKCISVE